MTSWFPMLHEVWEVRMWVLPHHALACSRQGTSSVLCFTLMPAWLLSLTGLAVIFPPGWVVSMLCTLSPPHPGQSLILVGQVVHTLMPVPGGSPESAWCCSEQPSALWVPDATVNQPTGRRVRVAVIPSGLVSGALSHTDTNTQDSDAGSATCRVTLCKLSASVSCSWATKLR